MNWIMVGIIWAVLIYLIVKFFQGLSERERSALSQERGVKERDEQGRCTLSRERPPEDY